MLRITVLNDERGLTFKLEGKLAHEWVAEAEKAWTDICNLPQQQRIIVDLCGVSFVDEAGRQLLVRMHACGAKLIGTGPMSSALIEEICGDGRSSGPAWIRSVLSLLFLLLVGTARHESGLYHYARFFFARDLTFAIPGWILRLQGLVIALWKGPFL